MLTFKTFEPVGPMPVLGRSVITAIGQLRKAGCRDMRTVEAYYEDYVIGDARETTGRTMTEADIVLHAGQTGDFFPHHMDAEWCATQPFERRVAHGTLVMSMAVGMTAGDINPRAMSYGYDRVRFVRPVYIGDTLKVRAEISGKNDHRRRPEELGMVEETVTVTNQTGDVVLALVHLYVVEKRGLAAQAD